MMSAVTAQTAHADDPFTDIVNDVEAELGYAQTAFSQAATDFGGVGNAPGGLAQLFIGTDDDLVGVPDIPQVGMTDALTGVTVIPASDFNFSDLALSPAFPTTTPSRAPRPNAKLLHRRATLANDITSFSPSDYADTALDKALSTAASGLSPPKFSTSAT